MILKTVFVTAVVTLLGFGMSPLFASQMPGMQMPATSQTDNNKKSLDTEMMDHQKEMQTLLAKLDESLKAITDARDEKGYVRDKAVLKAHEVNIKALRDAVRDHKLFLSNYEHQCGVNSKQQDAMVQHQQMMKGVLYDVVESFDTYEMTNDAPNNPNYTPIEDIGPAFVAHREALKELSADIAQHQQAMEQMVKKCS
jgi:hypothetical protein